MKISKRVWTIFSSWWPIMVIAVLAYMAIYIGNHTWGWHDSPKTINFHQAWHHHWIWICMMLLLTLAVIAFSLGLPPFRFARQLEFVWLALLCFFVFKVLPTKTTSVNETPGVVKKSSNKKNDTNTKQSRDLTATLPKTDLKESKSSAIDSSGLLSQAQKVRLQHQADSLKRAVQAEADRLEKMKQQKKADQLYVCKIDKQMEAMRLQLDAIHKQIVQLTVNPPSLYACDEGQKLKVYRQSKVRKRKETCVVQNEKIKLGRHLTPADY